MINKNDLYKNAIVGDSRKIKIKTEAKFIDPDITYLETICNTNSEYSKPKQIYDEKYEIEKLYASLEPGIWKLNGSADIYPDDPDDLNSEVGFQSGYICDDNMEFEENVTVSQELDNVSLLKIFSVMFPGNDYGVASDFVVTVYSNNGLDSETFSIHSNTKSKVDISNISIEDVTSINIEIEKWSIPNRRARIVELIVGLYDVLTEDDISHLSTQQQVDFTCITLPYGYCNISINNADKKFSSNNKTGLFEILEERQPMKISLGVLCEDGSFDYTNIGTYYMYNGGWKENTNNLVIDWYLVDIVGLIADRPFKMPDILPTTLEGWVSEVMLQIGQNFSDKYEIEPELASKEVIAMYQDQLNDKTCGDILKNACMLSGCFPMASNLTGNLKISSVNEVGNSILLDNMNAYPIVTANKDYCQFEIKSFSEFPETFYNYFDGTSTSSTDILKIDNFFTRGRSEAQNIADYIRPFLGGNTIEITGRGDMSSECGDTDVIEFKSNVQRTGIRKTQEFTFNEYVLKNNKSTFIEVM